ncbi:hypothetical protein Tco_1359824 [Tanacetum coccineum]
MVDSFISSCLAKASEYCVVLRIINSGADHLTDRELLAVIRAVIPTQSDATHVFDRFIGTHPTNMRVNEDLCFTSAIDKNTAKYKRL